MLQQPRFQLSFVREDAVAPNKRASLPGRRSTRTVGGSERGDDRDAGEDGERQRQREEDPPGIDSGLTRPGGLGAVAAYWRMIALRRRTAKRSSPTNT